MKIALTTTTIVMQQSKQQQQQQQYKGSLSSHDDDRSIISGNSNSNSNSNSSHNIDGMMMMMTMKCHDDAVVVDNDDDDHSIDLNDVVYGQQQQQKNQKKKLPVLLQQQQQRDAFNDSASILSPSHASLPKLPLRNYYDQSPLLSNRMDRPEDDDDDDDISMDLMNDVVSSSTRYYGRSCNVDGGASSPLLSSAQQQQQQQQQQDAFNDSTSFLSPSHITLPKLPQRRGSLLLPISPPALLTEKEIVANQQQDDDDDDDNDDNDDSSMELNDMISQQRQQSQSQSQSPSGGAFVPVGDCDYIQNILNDSAYQNAFNDSMSCKRIFLSPRTSLHSSLPKIPLRSLSSPSLSADSILVSPVQSPSFWKQNKKSQIPRRRSLDQALQTIMMTMQKKNDDDDDDVPSNNRTLNDDDDDDDDDTALPAPQQQQQQQVEDEPILIKKKRWHPKDKKSAPIRRNHSCDDERLFSPTPAQDFITTVVPTSSSSSRRRPKWGRQNSFDKLTDDFKNDEILQRPSRRVVVDDMSDDQSTSFVEDITTTTTNTNTNTNTKEGTEDIEAPIKDDTTPASIPSASFSRLRKLLSRQNSFDKIVEDGNNDTMLQKPRNREGPNRSGEDAEAAAAAATTTTAQKSINTRDEIIEEAEAPMKDKPKPTSSSFCRLRKLSRQNSFDKIVEDGNNDTMLQMPWCRRGIKPSAGGTLHSVHKIGEGGTEDAEAPIKDGSKAASSFSMLRKSSKQNPFDEIVHDENTEKILISPEGLNPSLSSLDEWDANVHDGTGRNAEEIGYDDTKVVAKTSTDDNIKIFADTDAPLKDDSVPSSSLRSKVFRQNSFDKITNDGKNDAILQRPSRLDCSDRYTNALQSAIYVISPLACEDEDDDGSAHNLDDAKVFINVEEPRLMRESAPSVRPKYTRQNSFDKINDGQNDSMLQRPTRGSYPDSPSCISRDVKIGVVLPTIPSSIDVSDISVTRSAINNMEEPSLSLCDGIVAEEEEEEVDDAVPSKPTGGSSNAPVLNVDDLSDVESVGSDIQMSPISVTKNLAVEAHCMVLPNAPEYDIDAPITEISLTPTASAPPRKESPPLRPSWGRQNSFDKRRKDVMLRRPIRQETFSASERTNDDPTGASASYDRDNDNMDLDSSNREEISASGNSYSEVLSESNLGQNVALSPTRRGSSVRSDDVLVEDGAVFKQIHPHDAIMKAYQAEMSKNDDDGYNQLLEPPIGDPTRPGQDLGKRPRRSSFGDIQQSVVITADGSLHVSMSTRRRASSCDAVHIDLSSGSAGETICERKRPRRSSMDATPDVSTEEEFSTAEFQTPLNSSETPSLERPKWGRQNSFESIVDDGNNDSILKRPTRGPYLDLSGSTDGMESDNRSSNDNHDIPSGDDGVGHHFDTESISSPGAVAIDSSLPVDHFPMESKKHDEKEDLSASKRNDGGGPSSALKKLAEQFFRGVAVSTHTYHFKKYENTFVGREAVDFMISSGMALTREDAVFLGQRFMKEINLFHHVCWDHTFKDDYKFYHYNGDLMASFVNTGSFLLPEISLECAEFNMDDDDDDSLSEVTDTSPNSQISYRGLKRIADIFKRNVLVSTHTYHFKRYKKTFIGREAVDFMVQTKMVQSRKAAVFLGQRLLEELDLFHHVCHDHQFKDEHLFYMYNEDYNDDVSARNNLSSSASLASFSTISDSNRSWIVATSEASGSQTFEGDLDQSFRNKIFGSWRTSSSRRSLQSDPSRDSLDDEGDLDQSFRNKIFRSWRTSSSRRSSQSDPSRDSLDVSKLRSSIAKQSDTPSSSKRNLHRTVTVRWDTIQVRVYERILEVHPSTSSGPSVGLGWQYNEEAPKPFQNYRAESDSGEGCSSDFVLSRRTRKAMLVEWGFSKRQITQASKLNEKLRQRRKQTLNALTAKNMDDDRKSRSRRRRNGRRRSLLG